MWEKLRKIDKGSVAKVGKPRNIERGLLWRHSALTYSQARTKLACKSARVVTYFKLGRLNADLLSCRLAQT